MELGRTLPPPASLDCETLETHSLRRLLSIVFEPVLLDGRLMVRRTGP